MNKVRKPGRFGIMLELIILELIMMMQIQGKEMEFQSLYQRIPQTFLRAIPLKVLDNTTVETCARSCVKETEFECKSFDMDNIARECHLHNHTHTEPLVGLQRALGLDHYRTAYEKLFNRIPNHVITMRHNRNIRGLTVEECARRCILEMSFKCRGFDYERMQRNCWLTDKFLTDVGGLKKRTNTDYYERKTNGLLNRFINYGYGSLQTIEGVQTHTKIVIGVNLDACAQLCLAETAFSCVSFDYVFREQSCQLSQFIAANVHGLRTEFDAGYQVMHFELIDEYLEKFYPTPYGSILGHNERTYRQVTPDACARKCLEEKEFICRSFDYQIQKGTCLLSHVTGSDAGGLFTPEGVHVHHFEMKPSLDCGGYLSGEKGTLASPNWPRHYSHHLNCTWAITVPEFKIIHLNIYHLDLGLQTNDPCDLTNDILSFSEITDQGRVSTCLQNYQSEFSTLTNTVNITFTTNAENDAQGFRIFYEAELLKTISIVKQVLKSEDPDQQPNHRRGCGSGSSLFLKYQRSLFRDADHIVQITLPSDWPCRATLTSDKGEFASPNWPNTYPPMSSCHWLIKSTDQARVVLRINSVELEDHLGSSCRTAYDKIIIYDGDSDNSRRIKTLCGHERSISFTSSGAALYVVFISDSRVQAKGFHAAYTFLPVTTTTSTTTSTTTTTLQTTTTKSSTERVITYAKIDIPLDTTTGSTNNISSAVHLAMVGEEDEESVPLEAVFVEPLETFKTKQRPKENASSAVNGKTSDDIGRGVDIPEISTDYKRPDRDYTSLILGIASAFLIMFFIMALALVLVCRHYRKRVPKIRQGTNINNSEENLSLCNKTGGNVNEEFQDEADIDDAARLPLPGDHSPIPDVEFHNPLYCDRRRRRRPSRDSADSTSRDLEHSQQIETALDDSERSDTETVNTLETSLAITPCEIIYVDCLTTV